LNVSLLVAKRYLFAKKSHHIINIISGVSLLGVAVATAALCIILSIFNGLQNFVGQSVNAMSPDIEITQKYGKIIADSSISIAQLSQIEGVEYLSGVLSDAAVFVHQNQQYIAKIKGVETDYYRINRMDTLTEGHFELQYKNFPLAVLGAGVAFHLNCQISPTVNNSLTVYYPNRLQKRTAVMNENSLQRATFSPSGIFYSYTDFDNEFVFVPIAAARELLGYKTGFTSIEIRCKSDVNKNKVQKEITQLAGKNFYVKNAYQQQEELYKVMQSEKWITYAILAFILLIATFNMTGMMAILMLEKKKSTQILYCMGGNLQFIRRIFVYQGMLISGIGLLCGLCIGLIFCLLQHIFGFLTFGGNVFLLKAYPIDVQMMDILLICLIVISISFFMVNLLVRKLFPHKKTKERN
jgi:lipoprotein-releasing system permease protein